MLVRACFHELFATNATLPSKSADPACEMTLFMSIASLPIPFPSFLNIFPKGRTGRAKRSLSIPHERAGGGRGGTGLYSPPPPHLPPVSLFRNHLSFWMICWYIFRSHTQPTKLSTTIVFIMNLHVLAHQKNTVLDDFHDLFAISFGICFWITFGIDSGSILASFWYTLESVSHPFS